MKRYILCIVFMLLLITTSCTEIDDGRSERVSVSHYESLGEEDKELVDKFVEFLPEDVVLSLISYDVFGFKTSNSLTIRKLPNLNDGRDDERSRPSSWYFINEVYSLEIPFMNQFVVDGVASIAYDYISVQNEDDGSSVAIGNKLFEATWEKMLLLETEYLSGTKE